VAIRFEVASEARKTLLLVMAVATLTVPVVAGVLTAPRPQALESLPLRLERWRLSWENWLRIPLTPSLQSYFGNARSSAMMKNSNWTPLFQPEGEPKQIGVDVKKHRSKYGKSLIVSIQVEGI
jgi:hypothetical protein